MIKCFKPNLFQHLNFENSYISHSLKKSKLGSIKCYLSSITPFFFKNEIESINYKNLMYSKLDLKSWSKKNTCLLLFKWSNKWFEPKLNKEFKCNQMNLNQFCFFKQEEPLYTWFGLTKVKNKKLACGLICYIIKIVVEFSYWPTIMQ